MKATLGKLKGKDLRPTQEQALEFIRQSDRRFIAVRGPTGVGKTCIGFEGVTPPFFYVCSSIELEEQTERDYPEAVQLKGRGNYECDVFGTADLCIYKKPCLECDYVRARTAAMVNPLTILNFHYFLYFANYTRGFKARNIIIDEADGLEAILTSMIEFNFSMQKLSVMGIIMKQPDKKTSIASITDWLEECDVRIVDLKRGMDGQVAQLEEDLKSRKPYPNELKMLRRYREITRLTSRIEFLCRQDLSENWIYRYDDDKDRITLKPIWLTRNLTDEFLFRHGIRFLFMSATLPSKSIFCGMFGIKAEELDFLDLPNVWESEKRKILYKPSFNITHGTKHGSERKVRDAIEEILNVEKGRGIIHTTSYEMAKMIDGVDERLILHTGTNKDKQFEKYRGDKGSVFVSPSSTRGLDLPYDLCEFIIWLKAPFLHLKDPQVNARLYGSGMMGKNWYASDTIQTIIQGCGRGFRSEDDYCTIYLLDEQIGRLLTKHASFWPMWFRDLVRFNHESNDWEN